MSGSIDPWSQWAQSGDGPPPMAMDPNAGASPLPGGVPDPSMIKKGLAILQSLSGQMNPMGSAAVAPAPAVPGALDPDGQVAMQRKMEAANLLKQQPDASAPDAMQPPAPPAPPAPPMAAAMGGPRAPVPGETNLPFGLEWPSGGAPPAGPQAPIAAALGAPTPPPPGPQAPVAAALGAAGDPNGQLPKPPVPPSVVPPAPPAPSLPPGMPLPPSLAPSGPAAGAPAPTLPTDKAAAFSAPYVPGKTNYYPLVRAGESGGTGDTSIKNPNSTAHGPVQVTQATGDAFLSSPAGQGMTVADLNTVAGSQRFTQWNGDTNAQIIAQATGKPPTTGEVVAAHLVGGQGAASLLTHPDTPIKQLLTPGAISGNRSILDPNMTGAQAMVAIQNYYAGKGGSGGDSQFTGSMTADSKTTPPPFGLFQQQKLPFDPAELGKSQMGTMGLLALASGILGGKSFGHGLSEGLKNMVAVGADDRKTQMAANAQVQALNQLGITNDYHRVLLNQGQQKADTGTFRANTSLVQGNQRLDQGDQRIQLTGDRNNVLQTQGDQRIALTGDRNNVLQTQGDRRLDQGDVRLGQGDRRLDQGDTRLQQTGDRNDTLKDQGNRRLDQGDTRLAQNDPTVKQNASDARLSYTSNLKTQATSNTQANAAREQLRTLDQYKIDNVAAGPDIISRAKRSVSQLLGIDVLGNNPTAEQVATAMENSLQRGTLQNLGIGRILQNELPMLKGQVGGLMQNNPAAIKTIHDTIRRAAQARVDAEQGFGDLSPDQKAEIMHTPGGYNLWLQNAMDTAYSNAGTRPQQGNAAPAGSDGWAQTPGGFRYRIVK